MSTPRYDALIAEIAKLPRIEGDKALMEFSREMEQMYMDSRFDDITKDGSIAIWNAVQKLSPWGESNDMPWEEEILCGLSGAQMDKNELSEELAKANERLATILKECATFKEAHWPRLAALVAKEHDFRPECIVYPSCLAAIEQLAKPS